MVVFLCSACNASLRKNTVEKHFFRCRGCRTISCMDCHRDFDKTSFKAHTTCITEKEKYDKLRVADNKTGVNKQQQWTSFVQDAINKSNIQDPLIRQVMQELQSAENLPRKKAKFQNFMKSKYRRLHPDQVEQIWEILNPASKCESSAVSEPPPKRQTLEKDIANHSPTEPTSPAFSFTKSTRQVLKETNGVLSFSKLTSKLYSVYKDSVSSSSCQLPPHEFEERLLNIVSSKKSFSYSADDGLVHLVARKSSEDSIPPSQEVDLDQETPNQITCTAKAKSFVNGSTEKSLSDWVVDILQANEGQIRLKRLHKQLFDALSDLETPPESRLTMENLQHRLEKRFKKANRFTLSDDGKYVLLLQNGTT